ncbi:MAG: hypothetical protein KGL55_13530 [Rhodospirillales bacterium]|nr:hypothetical protein [Rhodospirillales bacterium]
MNAHVVVPGPKGRRIGRTALYFGAALLMGLAGPSVMGGGAALAAAGGNGGGGGNSGGGNADHDSGGAQGGASAEVETHGGGSGHADTGGTDVGHGGVGHDDSHGPGAGALAAALGALNAAHASPTALAHAAPNSQVGKLSTYDHMMQAALAMPSLTATQIAMRNQAIATARSTALASATTQPLTAAMIARVDDLLDLPATNPNLGAAQ